MLEMPQQLDIINQINTAVQGKQIMNVITSHSQHKLIWYNCDPKQYQKLLVGKTIAKMNNYKGIVQIKAEDAILLFSEGIEIGLCEKGNMSEKQMKKHQLVLELEDMTILTASVQMYGGIWCFIENEIPHPFFGSCAPNL